MTRCAARSLRRGVVSSPTSSSLRAPQQVIPAAEQLAKARKGFRFGLKELRADRCPFVPLAQEGKLQESLDKLLALEKQARNVSARWIVCLWRRLLTERPSGGIAGQASDLASTSRLLIAVIDILFSHSDYAQLNTYLHTLSRKHGQLRQAVQKMVDKAMEFVDKLEGEDKLKLIETLREITEGKVRPSGSDSLQCGSCTGTSSVHSRADDLL